MIWFDLIFDLNCGIVCDYLGFNSRLKEVSWKKLKNETKGRGTIMVNNKNGPMNQGSFSKRNSDRLKYALCYYLTFLPLSVRSEDSFVIIHCIFRSLLLSFNDWSFLSSINSIWYSSEGGVWDSWYSLSWRFRWLSAMCFRWEFFIRI